MSTEIELAEMNVYDLKSYPHQEEYFGRRSEEELNELAGAITRGGMDPLDVLPDGTVLSGHQRLFIAKTKLQLEQVPVRIRHDIAAKGADAAEEFFLTANTANRRLSILQTVKAYDRGKELEAKRRKAEGTAKSSGRVRDVVAQRLGMKARKLEDWSKLLAAPRNVQLAVEAGKLTLKDGLRVANAPPEHQQQISQAIEHGQPARKAVIAVLEFAPRKPLDEKGYARRWRSMALAARDLFKALPGSREALHKHQHYWLRWLFELADSLSDLRPDVAARVKNLEEGVDQERLSQLVAIVRGDRQDIGQLEAQAKGMPKHLVLTAKSRLPLAPLTSAAG